jgi:hypothetical protein
MMHPLMDSIRYTGIFFRLSLDIGMVHTKGTEEKEVVHMNKPEEEGLGANNNNFFQVEPSATTLVLAKAMAENFGR